MKKVIWVDDLTLPNGLGENVNEAAKATGINLLVAGEDKGGDPYKRGTRALKNFKRLLDEYQSKHTEVFGLIIDIQIHCGSLEIFGSKFSRIDTAGGAETGYQLARYVLGTSDLSVKSDYGDAFCEKPILFLSGSTFVDIKGGDSASHTFVSWMGDGYMDLDRHFEAGVSDDFQVPAYAHLEKRYLGDFSKLRFWMNSLSSTNTPSA